MSSHLDALYLPIARLEQKEEMPWLQSSQISSAMVECEDGAQVYYCGGGGFIIHKQALFHQDT